MSTNQTPAGTTHFVHDIFGNVIAESFFSALRMPTRIRAEGGGATGATGTVREYIWLPETQIAPTMGSRTVVDRPLAVVNAVNTASPVTWYIHADHLNRPVKMTDAAKAAVWTATWAPWGSPHSITGTATLDARFPGQWYQMEAGLHYNWHRSYDPTLGRYTQPDPLGFVDGPGVFGYAAQSPYGYVDQDGRWIWLIPRAIIAFCERYPSACITIVELAIDFWNDECGGGKYEKPPNPNKKNKVLREKQRERNVKHPDAEEHSIRPKGGPRGGRIGR